MYSDVSTQIWEDTLGAYAGLQVIYILLHLHTAEKTNCFMDGKREQTVIDVGKMCREVIAPISEVCTYHSFLYTCVTNEILL